MAFPTGYSNFQIYLIPHLMNDLQPNWSDKELKAYLLLYSAYADFNESENEKSLIISKVGKDNYQHIHDEIEQDNDYVRIQKIKNSVQQHKYSHDQIDRLIEEMKELFNVDGEDILEQNLLIGLKHVLQQ